MFRSVLQVPLVMALSIVAGQTSTESPSSNNAGVSGQVMEAASRRPVFGAAVTFNSRHGELVVRVESDRNGKYSAHLPAGSYFVDVSRPGFVKTTFGATSHQPAGSALRLQSRSTMNRVNFVLTRGSVISGKVIDDLDEPVIDARIDAVTKDGASLGYGYTNDLGNFRLYGLPREIVYVRVQLDAGHEAYEFYSTPIYYPNSPDMRQARRIVLAGPGEYHLGTIVLTPSH
jgi:Carboxypeptidase regulatory-like domain